MGWTESWPLIRSIIQNAHKIPKKKKGNTLSYFLNLCVWKVDVMAGLPAPLLKHKVNVLTLEQWRGKLEDPETRMSLKSIYTSPGMSLFKPLLQGREMKLK